MARGCPSAWGNLPCAWTASRWAEPDKRTLAEFIPACRLRAACPSRLSRPVSWPCPLRTSSSPAQERGPQTRERLPSEETPSSRRQLSSASPSRLEIRDATSAGGDRDPDTERKDAGDFGARGHRCARY